MEKNLLVWVERKVLDAARKMAHESYVAGLANGRESQRNGDDIITFGQTLIANEFDEMFYRVLDGQDPFTGEPTKD